MSHSSSVASRKIHLTASVIFTLIAATVLLATSAYFFRNAVVMYSANRYLRAWDIELIKLQGFEFNHSRMEVSDAVLRVNGSTKEQRLNNIVVTYSFSGLRNGTIESIRVEEAMLSLPLAPSDPTSSPQPALDTAQLLAILQDLPVSTVAVTQLNLPPYLHNAALHLSNSTRELRLQLSAGELALTSSVNWHNQDFVSSHFISNEQLATDALSPRVLTGRLEIENNRETILDIDFSLNEADPDLELEAVATIKPQTLPELISPYVTLPAHWPQLTGSLNASLRARLEKSSSNIPYYHLTLNPGSHLSASNLDGILPTLEQASVEVNLTSPVHISGRFPADEDFMQITSEQVSLQFKEIPDVGELALQITDLRTHCQSAQQCTSQQALSVSMDSLAINQLQISAVQFSGTASASFNDSILTVATGSDFSASAGSISIPAQGLLLSQAQFTAVNPIELEAGAAGISISGQQLTATLPFIQLPRGISKTTLKVSEFNLLAHDGIDLLMNFVAIETGSELIPVNLNSAVFDGQLEFADDLAKLTGDFHLNGQHALTIDVLHTPTSGKGSADILLPGIYFDTLWSRLSDFIQPLPINVDLLAGGVSGQGQISWHQDASGQWQFNGPVTLSINEITGSYEEIGFAGVSTELSLELLDDMNLRTPETRPLQIAAIDAGVPIENVRLDYSFNTLAGTLSLQNLYAEIFQGIVTSEGMVYDRAAESTTMLVELQRIDLENVLSLAAYDAVSASGKVSGQLPITLRGDKVSISAGNLFALAPGGAIRYQPEGPGDALVSSGNAGLDLVYQALSNYRYQMLQSSVDYLEDGELMLSVKLEGINPDMGATGQQINLNLNISDNIPALLQSLQASRSITDALEQRLNPTQ